MKEKWNKKMVIQYAQELRSPFEDTDGQRPKLAQLGDRVKQLLQKRKV